MAQVSGQSVVVDRGEPGGGASGGSPCWYLTGKGTIIRGQPKRDPDWEDRKASIYGGMKFLGHAEYGNGGDCLPALLKFVGKHPELQPIIDRNRANKANRQYEIANRHQIKMQKAAESKAMEAAAIAEAVRQVISTNDADEDDTDSDTPARRRGRPPKAASGD